MNVKNLSSLMIGFILSLLLIAPVQAANKKAQNAEEMQAQMAKAKEAGAPGADHAVLNPLVGNWTVTSRSWMGPRAKVQHSTGSSTNSWVLGGRFIRQEFRSNWAGQSFEGLGFVGYDKVKKEYTSIWMDNMSTGIMRSSGQYDVRTKTIKDSGTFSCPMTGNSDTPFRATLKIVNNNKLIYTMFMQDPNGREFKSMELVYNRTR